MHWLRLAYPFTARLLRLYPLDGLGFSPHGYFWRGIYITKMYKNDRMVSEGAPIELDIFNMWDYFGAKIQEVLYCSAFAGTHYGSVPFSGCKLLGFNPPFGFPVVGLGYVGPFQVLIA